MLGSIYLAGRATRNVKHLPAQDVRLSLNNGEISSNSSISEVPGQTPEVSGVLRRSNLVRNDLVYVHSISRYHTYGVLVYGSNGAPSRSAFIWNAKNLEKSRDMPKSPDVCQIAGSVAFD
jgi:hypothetical protein